MDQSKHLNFEPTHEPHPKDAVIIALINKALEEVEVGYVPRD